VATNFTTSLKNVIKMDALTLDEANDLLASRLPEDSGLSNCTELAMLLDGVPLALVQATAYTSNHSCSVLDYIDLYNESDKNKVLLLSENFEDDV